MDHLWTPWRYTYVTQPKDQNPDAQERVVRFLKQHLDVQQTRN